MAKRDKIKKIIKKQDEEIYGDESISGSSPDPESDDDTEETLEETVGGNVKKEDPFSLGEEVKKDEKARRTKPKIDIDEED